MGKNRLLGLIKSLSNPPFFFYRVFHYLRIYVPIVLAKYIAMGNANELSDYGINQLISFNTYDGSNQVCHPDITYWNNSFWVVVTPYPYGMEEYENPTLYKKATIDSDFDMVSLPLARPRKHHYGFHLSDPCIFQDDIGLKCLYRENWKDSKDNSICTLWISSFIKDENQWSTPISVLEENADPLLSPAVIIDKDNNMHIYTADNTTSIKHFSFFSGKCIGSSKIECYNIPPHHNVWHIAIVYQDSRDKKWDGSDSLLGLFLLKNSNNNQFVLYEAKSSGVDQAWTIGAPVRIDSHLTNNSKTVYKSCFVPFSNQKIISIRDKKDRYKLFIIND